MPKPKTKARVFIVNDSGHDFSAAEKYGDLVVMSSDTIDKYNVMAMKRVFSQHLLGSRPGDWLLHSGPGVMSALACSIFAAKHGRLNLLLWRAEASGTDRYVPRRIVFNKRGKREAKNETPEAGRSLHEVVPDQSHTTGAPGN